MPLPRGAMGWSGILAFSDHTHFLGYKTLARLLNMTFQRSYLAIWSMF